MFLSKSLKIFSFLAAVAIVAGGAGFSKVAAAAEKVGPKACEECHSAETKVWEGTKHHESFKTVHKEKRAKQILKAVGDKRMKRSDTCKMCHYTEAPKKAGGDPKIVAGPACESCHGAASEWISIHNDFGKGVKREDESAEHKAMRLQKAEAAGMIRPVRLFDVASNCMTCHGLAAPGLDAKTAAAMLDNDHPLNPDFELVKYSQGSVRHRFYPEFKGANPEMNDVEKSRMFVIGQAAALVNATAAMGKSDHAKYKAAQEKRIATAKSVLDAVKGSVPEAAALLADPSVANGRALGAAIADKDLSGAVGGMLPKEFK